MEVQDHLSGEQDQWKQEHLDQVEVMTGGVSGTSG
jgi:hypothetical protein